MQAVLYLLALTTNHHFSKVLPANQSDFSHGSHPPPSGPSASSVSRGRPCAPNKVSSLHEGLLMLMLTFPPDLSAPICTKPRSTTADRELNIDLPMEPGPRIKTSPLPGMSPSTATSLTTPSSANRVPVQGQTHFRPRDHSPPIAQCHSHNIRTRNDDLHTHCAA
jgi:hypothetical protein